MGEASHGNDHNNPFSSLSFWRAKVASDLIDPQTEYFKLRVLLEQGKDCEQVRAGTTPAAALFRLADTCPI